MANKKEYATEPNAAAQPKKKYHVQVLATTRVPKSGEMIKLEYPDIVTNPWPELLEEADRMPRILKKFEA